MANKKFTLEQGIGEEYRRMIFEEGGQEAESPLQNIPVSNTEDWDEAKNFAGRGFTVFSNSFIQSIVPTIITILVVFGIIALIILM